ncbi:hypothetical protein [Catenulispora subtropica]|uniref:Knr4/Smi1-like domain-containing protein n=1 Tax=Catenulispora subtropica TaxID=450798 RepID=A0ABN2R194_9ACTN
MIFRDGVELGNEAARLLAERSASLTRCRIEPGLTDDEFAQIEREFGFEFADDHRAFLATGLPVSVPFIDPPGVISAWREPWPDWRDGDRDRLRVRLAGPVEGVLFDVERNGFWSGEWGARPDIRDEAVSIARAALAGVPTLVPVFGHRFLPSGRGTLGHPVLSVHQTDLVYYGLDLRDWVGQEFGGPGLDRRDDAWNPQATARFWRDLL